MGTPDIEWDSIAHTTDSLFIVEETQKEILDSVSNIIYTKALLSRINPYVAKRITFVCMRQLEICTISHDPCENTRAKANPKNHMWDLDDDHEPVPPGIDNVVNEFISLEVRRLSQYDLGSSVDCLDTNSRLVNIAHESPLGSDRSDVE